MLIAFASLLIGGWWIGALVLALFMGLLPVGYIIAGLLLGRMMMQRAGCPQIALAWSLLAGLIAFGVVRLVPLAGGVVALAALRAMSAARASVIRDGERQSVPGTEIVPGDVILVEEGDTVPANARLLQSTALQTAEASLTGESLPVSKDVAPLDEEVGLGDGRNMLFSRTAATYGRGTAVVTATGIQTEMGKIAGMLRQMPAESTPLQRELDRTGKLLGAIVPIIAAAVVITIIVVQQVRVLAAIVDVLILGVSLALSACTQAVMAAEVGHNSLALDYAAEAALIDLADIEHNSRDGLHLASLAGIWIALIAGFGGMRDNNGTLAFAPRLPDELSRLSFTVVRHGIPLRVSVNAHAVTYQLQDERGTLDLVHHGEQIKLQGTVIIERGIPPPVSREPVRQPPGQEPRRRSPYA